MNNSQQLQAVLHNIFTRLKALEDAMAQLKKEIKK
jgi:hypothetical protein